jgi:hypothetical protein
MRDHVKILGILNIIMGCITALIGLIALVVLGGIAGLAASPLATNEDHDAWMAAPVLVAIGFCAAIFFLILAAPAILGGWGLLRYKNWARVLMIIVSCLHLFHVPLGTALGVYGLWVLLSEETRRLFESGGQYIPPPSGAYPSPASYPPQPAYPNQPNVPPPPGA